MLCEVLSHTDVQVNKVHATAVQYNQYGTL